MAGCSSCGANARTVFNAPAPARNAQFLSKPENMPDAVLIMFRGNGKPSFRGRATGTLYTFQSERPRYVHARDAEMLLARPDMFPVNLQPVESLQGSGVPENAPVLTAPGPPNHLASAGQMVEAPVEVDVGHGEPLERRAAPITASSFDPSSIRVEDLPPPPPKPLPTVTIDRSHLDNTFDKRPMSNVQPEARGPTEAELEAAVAPTGANITNAANIAEIADDPESPDLESGDGGSTPPSGASDDLVRVPINELGNDEDPPAERPAPKRPVGRPRTQPTKAKAKK